jgi:hypothetical protein
VRVAFVSEVFLPAVDGVVTRLRRTPENLQRAGDEVLVIAPARPPRGGPMLPRIEVTRRLSCAHARRW